jgi:hypothetical protein
MRIKRRWRSYCHVTAASYSKYRIKVLRIPIRRMAVNILKVSRANTTRSGSARIPAFGGTTSHRQNQTKLQNLWPLQGKKRG